MTKRWWTLILLIAMAIACDENPAQEEEPTSQPESPASSLQEQQKEPLDHPDPQASTAQEQQQAREKHDSDQLDDGLTGRYAMPVDVAMDAGADELVYEDCLSLRQLPDNSLEYAATLYFPHAFTCELAGVADRIDDGHYLDVVEDEDFGACVLEILVEDDHILINDETGQCQRLFCGARAYLHGTSFPRDIRDPHAEIPCEGF